MKRIILITISLLCAINIFAQEPQQNNSGEINKPENSDEKKEAEERAVYMKIHEGLQSRTVKDAYGNEQSEGYVFYGTDKWAIPPKYHLTYDFTCGRGMVVRLNYDSDPEFRFSYGFVDRNGNEVIPLKYSYARPFVDGLASAYKKTEINKKIRSQYNLTKSKEKYLELGGLINVNGVEVVPLEYYAFGKYAGGGLVSAMRENGGKIGFLDTTGNVVIPFTYDPLPDDYKNFPVLREQFKLYGSKWLCIVKKGNKYGAIDKKGNEVLQLKYDSCEIVPVEDSGNAFIVSEGDKYGIVSLEGQVLMPVQYSHEEALFRKDLLYSVFLDSFIAGQMKDWNERGEFETTKEFDFRMSDAGKEKWMEEKQEEALITYGKYIVTNKLQGNLKLGRYDADDQTFTITTVPPLDFMKCTISVPLEEAKAFKNEWNNCKRYIGVKVENDLPQFSILKVILPATGDEEPKVYTYQDEE